MTMLLTLRYGRRIAGGGGASGPAQIADWNFTSGAQDGTWPDTIGGYTLTMVGQGGSALLVKDGYVETEASAGNTHYVSIPPAVIDRDQWTLAAVVQGQTTNTLALWWARWTATKYLAMRVTPDPDGTVSYAWNNAAGASTGAVGDLLPGNTDGFVLLSYDRLTGALHAYAKRLSDGAVAQTSGVVIDPLTGTPAVVKFGGGYLSNFHREGFYGRMYWAGAWDGILDADGIDAAYDNAVAASGLG